MAPIFLLLPLGTCGSSYQKAESISPSLESRWACDRLWSVRTGRRNILGLLSPGLKKTDSFHCFPTWVQLPWCPSWTTEWLEATWRQALEEERPSCSFQSWPCSQLNAATEEPPIESSQPTESEEILTSHCVKPLSFGMVCNAAIDNWNTSPWNITWLMCPDDSWRTLEMFYTTPASFHLHCFLPNLNHPHFCLGHCLLPVSLPPAILTPLSSFFHINQILPLKTSKFTSRNGNADVASHCMFLNNGNSLSRTHRIWPPSPLLPRLPPPPPQSSLRSRPIHQTNSHLRSWAGAFCPQPSSAWLFLVDQDLVQCYLHRKSVLNYPIQSTHCPLPPPPQHSTCRRRSCLFRELVRSSPCSRRALT